jgi:hypothetical protein
MPKKKPAPDLFNPRQHKCWLCGHPQSAGTFKVTRKEKTFFVTQTHMVGYKRTTPVTRAVNTKDPNAMREIAAMA